MVKIQTTVHPNSKKPRVEKDLFNDLHIYVSQPPLEGRANSAAIEALADYYRVAKSKIKLARGRKSKIKVFDIDM